MHKAKILTLDIETAPLQSYHWGLFDQNISLDMVKVDWTILSFSAKWLGEKKVIFKCTGGRGVKKVRDDKPLMGELWKLLDEADIVVAQNGKQFDIKKINTRLVFHGFAPYSPIQIVDTMLVAKGKFGFTSNKLAFLSEQLTDTVKSKHKKFPGFELWEQCLADNKEAWDEMQAYNSQDVVATEELYLKMRPWIDKHPNVAAYSTNEIPECPRCGSHHIRKDGIRTSTSGKFQRYRCNDCGGVCQGKENLMPKLKRKVLLAT